MSEPVERSKSGGPVFRHKQRERLCQVPDTSDSSLEVIEEHIEQHLGTYHDVLHEVVSDLVHLDVHVVPPNENRPWYTLVTSGASDRPMTPPPDCQGLEYAEFLVNLPAHWEMNPKKWKIESHYWPIRWLKIVARLAHDYDTWVWSGHSIPNGEPPKRFARNTKLCCMLVTYPISSNEGFHELRIRDDKVVHFWSLVPVYREELQLKLDEGTNALKERFDRHGIDDLINPRRINVAQRRWRNPF